MQLEHSLVELLSSLVELHHLREEMFYSGQPQSTKNKDLGNEELKL